MTQLIPHRARTSECSVDCVGESCASVFGYDGVCVATQAQSESACNSTAMSLSTNYLFQNGTCVLPAVTQSSCTQLSGSYQWVSCLSQPINSCGSISPQWYLGCYVSPWRPCQNMVFEFFRWMDSTESNFSFISDGMSKLWILL